jgi:serine/threonine protein kinase
MTITEPMILPPDVQLVPVEELPEELRAKFEHRPGDHALTRPRSRAPSTIVDRDTARLLGAFRKPTRIIDAIIGFATSEHVDPRQALERSYPMLKDLLGSGLLVPADSDLASPIGPSFEAGQTIGSYDVLRAVHLMIDTELYLARNAAGQYAAIKVATAGAESSMQSMLRNEWETLVSLDGDVAPRPLEFGEVNGRAFLAASWHPGVDAATAANELQALAPGEGRASLLDLCSSIIGAYANLHGHGVLHGDVHPNNVVVGSDGSVTLVDFGLAGRDGESIRRGGVDFFMDPETALVHRDGTRAGVPLTATGEQYSVAALLFFLVTGTHTHDFSLEPEVMLRQLADDPPVSFDRRLVTGLPKIEAVLVRALAKDPVARFAGMGDFLSAWQSAVNSDLAEMDRSATVARQPAAAAAGPGPAAKHLLAETLDRLALDGPIFSADLEAPRASVNLGAAGIAYGLLRIAMAHDDELLLALADLWSLKALGSLGTEEAFTNVELEITPEDFGTSGIHHSATGVYATAAHVAAARADVLALSTAIHAFVESGRDPGDQRDVSFGSAGILLGTASVLQSLAEDAAERAPLRDLGDAIASQAWSELSAPGPIGGTDQRAGVSLLGGAHGWAGMLYAQLRWAEATGADQPAGIEARLSELGRQSMPLRRGLVWPRELGASDDGALSSSWCNGAAGFVALWTVASELFPGDGFERLAQGAAWTAYDGPPAPGDLCCGLAGRSYALLNLYRATGDRIWLARASDLAERASVAVREGALRSDSLYKGAIGVAVLAADLGRPSESAMPFYDWAS